VNPKLIRIIPNLIRLALRQTWAKRLFQQYKGRRSGQLILTDEDSVTEIWVGIQEDGIKVRIGRFPATTTIKMDVDTFIDIVNGALDFRTALWHGLIQVESHDGYPWSYHAFLWASFWDSVAQILRD